MILEKQKEANVLTEGGSTESIGMSLDLDSAQVLMQMLSKNLYSDSIGSTIRECASNALDSHRRAGTDKPIIVSFTRNASNNYEFAVEDFGIGLDADDVQNIISKYGKSTKRNSTTELGMMGLGFKAPLAYSSSFYFVCRKDGVERKYMMYEGEDVNTIDLLYTKPTDECNGVKVIIPVKYNDKYDFIKKTKEQLAYFENVYFDIMDNEIDNNFVIFRGDDYQFSEISRDSNLHVCLDNVYYPLDFEKLGIDRIGFSVGLRFSLTDGLFPTPNRESLRYTQEAKQIILDKITKVANYFTDKYNESIKDTDDIFSIISYYTRSVRYINSFNSKFDLTELEKYASVIQQQPKLNNVELLNLKELITNTRDYWLGEYTPKACIERGKFRSLENRYYYDWRVNTINESKVYYYKDRISGVKRDYIKSIAKYGESTIIVRKDGEFKLSNFEKSGTYSKNYYKILSLNKYPKSQWRQVIKEFQYVLSLVTSNFIDLDELVLPQTFIDSRKKITAKVYTANGTVARRKKVAGEVTGKVATELLRYVDNKNCKWESSIISLDRAHTNTRLTIYGSHNDAEKLDKIYSFIKKDKIRLVTFSDRELKIINEIELHNWISLEKFMEGKNKSFKRIVTAQLIHSLFNKNRNVFGKLYRLENISKDLQNKLTTIEDYRLKWYVSGSDVMVKAMIEVAEDNNLFDESIYSVYLECKTILERLPFMEELFSKMRYDYNDVLMQCIVDLCKYHKYKVNLDKYKIRLTEDLPLENELTEETVDELIAQD